MKKIIDAVKQAVGLIILIPILLILCIGYLLFVPFDIVRYHKMPYYKDFKKKYELFITSSDIVQTYNRIVKEQLPIEYVKNNDFEYFVKDGQVLLCGWGKEQFGEIDNEWFFIFDGKHNINLSMEELLGDETSSFKSEHKDLPAKFLIFYNDITDAEKFEEAKKCPYFYCVFSVEEDL